MKPMVIVVALVALAAPPALAAPGDPLSIAGTLVWPPVLQSEPFAVLQTPDGRFYYADLASLPQRRAAALRAGDPIAVTGAEGLRPHEIVVTLIGAEHGLPTRPENEASPPRSAAPVERLDGRVDEISSRALVLRTGDGRRLSVDLSRVSGSAVDRLRRGDRVTVYGSRGGDDGIAAVALVYSGESG